MGLQFLVRSICDGQARRALVITPKPAASILGRLQHVVEAELRARDVAQVHAPRRVRECLDRVMLSCVFDLDGLWEVLADLDAPPPSVGDEEMGHAQQDVPSNSAPSQASSSPLSSIAEIQDSEDEGDSPLTSSQAANAQQPPPEQQPQQQPPPGEHQLPDIIVVTHFSSLLTSLFARRERSAAHGALQLLGSHLRHLSRTLPSSPLVLLLNSTSSSSPDSASSYSTRSPAAGAGAGHAPTKKPLDATLQSIFNPPPLPLPGYHAHAARRSNKPTFGLVFAQLLDLHLLCSRVPRARADADALYAPAEEEGEGEDGRPRPTRFVTVVEVLLDEMGLWEGRAGVRRSREQRWAAVEIEAGRLRDAFGVEAREDRNYEPIRLAAGFGGRRV